MPEEIGSTEFPPAPSSATRAPEASRPGGTAAPRKPSANIEANRVETNSVEAKTNRTIPSNDPHSAAQPSLRSTSADEKKEDLAAVAARNAPPWLVSALLHMLLVIVLGLWFLPKQLPKLISLEVLGSESGTEDGNGIDGEPISPIAGTEEANDFAAPDNLIETPTDDPFTAPPALEIKPGGTSKASPFAAPEIGLALAGRSEGRKKALLGRYGGTGGTEGAVSLGLTWLAKQQRSDGTWSLRGPYADGSAMENTTAATAMALLAFQGAGHTHEKGKYKPQVERGMNALLRFQDKEGNFYQGGPPHSALYCQAQATIAVCELYGMTQDKRLREPAQRAIGYCDRAQDKKLGGWRYYPGDDSDMSVTGWFVMALQSAKMAGLEVPSPTLELVNQFLESVALEGGSRYSYKVGEEERRSMTAEALLCRQWLGWAKDDPRLARGADLFVQKENLPSWDDRDAYYWYYATQVLHHLDDDRWQTWNHIMRELLPEKQEKKGPEAGSWHPTGSNSDAWGFHGGRLYVTSLSVYILEVYYRHLPIYAHGARQEVAGNVLPQP